MNDKRANGRTDGAEPRIKANRIIIYYKLIIFEKKKQEERTQKESFIFLKEQMFSLILILLRTKKCCLIFKSNEKKSNGSCFFFFYWFIDFNFIDTFLFQSKRTKNWHLVLVLFNKWRFQLEDKMKLYWIID